MNVLSVIMRPKMIATTIGAAILLELLHWKYKAATKSRKSNKKVKKLKKIRLTEDDLWNTVIFFPDPDLLFVEHDNSRIRQLMWYMDQAKERIDICIFCFNFRELEELLMKKAREGVDIRILSNKRLPKTRKLVQAGKFLQEIFQIT